MQKNTNDIIVFLIVVSALIISMVAFIVFMLTIYRKRQNGFQQSLEQIKLDNEKTLLATQLEIQEQTFQHISREIHDNISLSLTLAKLQLHTFTWDDKEASTSKMNTSIELITKSITELSDISKGLNADIIIQHGLLKAIEEELNRIRQAGLFSVEYELTGTPVYMDSQQELIVFRIIQEAFNNIIKHAKTDKASLLLHYNNVKLTISVSDNGNGFDTGLSITNRQAGLKNMENRAKMLGGQMAISSQPGHGTTLTFTIPFEKQ